MDPSIGSPASAVINCASSASQSSSPRDGNRLVPSEPVEIFPSASSVAVADSLVVNYILHPDVDSLVQHSLGHYYPSNVTSQTMEPFSETHRLRYEFGSGSNESSPAVQSINLPSIQNSTSEGMRSVTPLSGSSSHGVPPPPPVKKPAFSGNRAFNANSSSSAKCAESNFFYRNPNPAVRQRTAQACEKCRDRKTKCSGTRPTCKRCADRGLICVWAPETRSRGSAGLSKNRHQRRADLADNATPSAPMCRQEQSSPAQTHRPPPLTLDTSTHRPQFMRPGPGNRQVAARPDQLGSPQAFVGDMPITQASYNTNINNLFDPSTHYAITPQQRNLAEAAARAVVSGSLTPEEAWKNLICVVREQAHERAVVANAYGHMNMHDGFAPGYTANGYMVSLPEVDYGPTYESGSNDSSPPSATSSHFSVESSRPSETDYEQPAYNNVTNASDSAQLSERMINTLSFPETPAQAEFDQTPRPKSSATFPSTVGGSNVYGRRSSITGTADTHASLTGGNGGDFQYVEIDFSLLPGRILEKLEQGGNVHVALSPAAASDSSASSSPAPVLRAPIEMRVHNDDDLVAQFINTDIAYGLADTTGNALVQS